MNATAPMDFLSRDDSQAGFRLSRFEVLNWGTFDQAIWRLNIDGCNALLTGDIGSGKSTLVDALTTLLVPAHKITFNKAAGAESRERSLASYVRGDYKSERGESQRNARVVSLRSDQHFSVLLAQFDNPGIDQRVCLAQVLWFKPGEARPERFFVVAEKVLSIADDFLGHRDPLQLKKALKGREGVEIPDNFSRYSERFRQLMGIDNAQALELFYQTISMKAVANLTEFVRAHMLEAADSGRLIDDLKRNFDNLNAAHEAVRIVRKQIEQLTPLVADGEAYQNQAQALRRLELGREALPAFYASYTLELLDKRIATLELEQAKLAEREAQAKLQAAALQDKATSLRLDIERAGGGRLREIDSEIERGEAEQARLKQQHAHYHKLTDALGLSQVSQEHSFHHNRQQAEKLATELQSQAESLTQRQVELGVQRQQLMTERSELAADVESLKQRRSNIERGPLAIRAQLCEVLNLADCELPFAGELIRVREDASSWQGALERLLHNFGLSLLVPEAHYRGVSQYLEATRLRGRLVYFRVNEEAKPVSRGGPDNVPRKLEIKPEATCYRWLEQEIQRQFDYHCAVDLAAFSKHRRAITQTGQIKHNERRHEKDDRHRIDDRSRWVLGWNNADKIAALLARIRELDTQIEQIDGGLTGLKTQQDSNRQHSQAVQQLLTVAAFADIDWRRAARQIETLREEARALREANNVLQRLQNELETTETQRKEAAGKAENLGKEVARHAAHLVTSNKEHEEAQEQLDTLSEAERAEFFPWLHECLVEAGQQQPADQRSLRKAQSEFRAWMSTRIDNERKRIERQRERVLRLMSAYKTAWPADTSEIDASLDAVPAYAGLLRQRRDDDLPRHEAQFRQRLREGSINDIAHLHNELDLAAREISRKIERINRSLAQIDYDASAGTQIELVAERSSDNEITDFVRQLERCLEDSLSEGEALYSEEKFQQVKALVDRFKGRPDLADLDARWTAKVTDVRNWFEFSARELWRADGSEREFYSGSSGKSGGQKEKLAYTILASSLAYQFGLSHDQNQARSFRFVVIDEAFGRGSDESAQYGLQLFQRLNLQLLIVTPLQKIHVIEDYVQSVHFVHNQDGCLSQVRSLSISDYQAEKAQHAQSR